MKQLFSNNQSFFHRQQPVVYIPLCILFCLISGCTLQLPQPVSPTDAPPAEETTEEPAAAENQPEAAPESGPTEAAVEESESEAEPEPNAEATDSGAADTSTAEAASSNGEIQEQAVILLPLPEILGSANLEISAMDWFGDHLILVPQFPEAWDNQLFAIARQQILETIDGSRTGPLDVTPLPIDSGLLRLRIPRFYGGFEAIAFTDDRVYLTVEGGRSRDMAGYVVAGELVKDDSAIGLDKIVLDYEAYTEIASAGGLGNMSEEAIVVYNNDLLTIYEANGVNVNPSPVAHRIGADLSIQGRLPLPNIEYRITDATRVDADSRFWAINYLFPGDIEKLEPLEPEPLATRYGEGTTHQSLRTVERLVEFQIGERGISLTDTPPIQIELFGGDVEVLGRTLGDEIPRNWEGIVRLDDRGFLIATDKFPDTLLGFVAFPE